MKSSMIQRQLKLNAGILTAYYQIYGARKALRESCVLDEWWGDVGALTKNLKALLKRIKALEQLQKALKKDLNEVYCKEYWDKSWEAFDDNPESFLAGRARMAAEDGFVEPGVVLETLEVK